MPRAIVPRRLTYYRVAAIALYRALLTQCRAVPLDDEQRSRLQDIVRNRFRKNTELVSPRLLKLAFIAGYEAIDTLDASVAGNSASTARISELLSKVPAHVFTGKPKRPEPPPPPPDANPPPPEQKLLAKYPRETVEGRRKVPILVNVHGFPLLRLGKPQPRNLSRVLRQKLGIQHRNTTVRNWMVDYFLPLSGYEDVWDSLVAEAAAAEGVDVNDMSLRRPADQTPLSTNISWNTNAYKVFAHAKRLYEKELEKARVLSAKMQGIVDRETELAEQEKFQRRKAAWKKRNAKNRPRLNAVRRAKLRAAREELQLSRIASGAPWKTAREAPVLPGNPNVVSEWATFKETVRQETEVAEREKDQRRKEAGEKMAPLAEKGQESTPAAPVAVANKVTAGPKKAPAHRKTTAPPHATTPAPPYNALAAATKEPNRKEPKLSPADTKGPKPQEEPNITPSALSQKKAAGLSHKPLKEKEPILMGEKKKKPKPKPKPTEENNPKSTEEEKPTLKTKKNRKLSDLDPVDKVLQNVTSELVKETSTVKKRKNASTSQTQSPPGQSAVVSDWAKLRETVDRQLELDAEAVVIGVKKARHKRAVVEDAGRKKEGFGGPES